LTVVLQLKRELR